MKSVKVNVPPYLKCILYLFSTFEKSFMLLSTLAQLLCQSAALNGSTGAGMPHEKTRYKFRCGEPACGNVVRSDKWTEHCRNKHAFKFARYAQFCDIRILDSLDEWLTSQNKTIVEQNRRVMYVAVKVMKYLASEMMAVRGHTSQDGNFLHLFRVFRI